MFTQKIIAQILFDNFARQENPLDANINLIGITLEGKRIVPDIRYFSQLEPVLLEYDKLHETMNTAYFMYRDIYQKNELRYDITVIPFAKIGIEYNKTLGHYHPVATNGLSYPEVYQVIYGSATYVLQRKDYETNKVTDVKIIEANEGDIVVIMPNYGHVTVNKKTDLLIMSNIVYCNFNSDYSDFVKKKGAIFYITKDGIIKNNNYEENVEYSVVKAKDYNKHFVRNCFGKEKDILATLIYNHEQLAFLKNPTLLKNHVTAKN
ncbi:MAG: glucose-6-phosphate isomerase [Candidatus Micrarchaeota archaeon]|nr:glucose-6-phosphate isomerase [Candidatus Micrarchaeota archaeon]